MKYLTLVLVVTVLNPYWGQYNNHYYGKPLSGQSQVAEKYKFEWHFGGRKNLRGRPDSGKR
jgi:hypothetical protein